MPITKTDYKYLQLIDQLEPKTHCLRAQIACLIVKNNKILISHNNDWLQEYDCTKMGCIRDCLQIPSGHQREICYGICAEQWCVAEAARQGISLQGSTLYCTKHPCRICASLIAVVGIKKVIYQEGYPDVIPHFHILKSRKIEVIQAPVTEYKSKKISRSHTI